MPGYGMSYGKTGGMKKKNVVKKRGGGMLKKRGGGMKPKM